MPKGHWKSNSKHLFPLEITRKAGGNDTPLFPGISRPWRN